jgi:peptide/nickel transport system permease protein
MSPFFRRSNGATTEDERLLEDLGDPDARDYGPTGVTDGGYGNGATTYADDDDPVGVRGHLEGAVELGGRGMDPGALAGPLDFVSIGTVDAEHAHAGSDEASTLPLWRQMWRVFLQNRLAVASVIILTIIILVCFIGPFFYHTNQTNGEEVLFQPQNLPPSSAHPLGTDNQGWDVLGRIMYGGEFSLTLGALAGFITIVVGTFYGMVSGFFGGAVDAVMMRLIDAFLSIPYLFLLIALITVFGNTTTFLILVIGLTGWWGNARIIRSDALAIRDLEYSQASRSMGGSKVHVVRRHVFPNSISNIVTVGTFSVADAILALTTLGFLGLGIRAPQTDWGTMLTNGVNALYYGYWWEVYPLTVIFIAVIICINYIGDALRDVFEVRLRER